MLTLRDRVKADARKNSSLTTPAKDGTTNNTEGSMQEFLIIQSDGTLKTFPALNEAIKTCKDEETIIYQACRVVRAETKMVVEFYKPEVNHG